MNKLINDLTEKIQECKNESIKFLNEEEHLKSAIKEGMCIAYKYCLIRLNNIKKDYDIFEGTKPLEGEPLKCLAELFEKSGTKNPMLPNRL